jgi:hypothetical protein
MAKRDNVPVLSLFQDTLEERQFSYGDGQAPTSALSNKSFGRVDLSFRPELKYELGNEKRPVMTDWFILPQFTTTLAPGLRASLRSRVHLEEPGGQLIDRTLLTFTNRPAGGDILWTASAGKFKRGQQGVFGEAQWELGNSRLGVRLARLGETLSDLHVPMWLGYYEYEMGGLGLTVRATAGRFIDWDKATALLELDRRFGESTIDAGVTFGDTPTRVGIVRLSVPLGPRRVQDPARLRLRPANYWALDYISAHAPGTDELSGDQDLRTFRGELIPAYLTAHPQRLSPEQQDTDLANMWPTGSSHEGLSGLIRIPTADVLPDGSWRISASYIDRDHTLGVFAGRTAMVPTFINVGFLPGLEAAFRYTILPDVQAFQWHIDTDRSLAAQYQLWPQEGSRPAVAIGAQDISFSSDSSVLERAEYIVATRQEGRWRQHVGFGRHRLNGIFSGVEYRCAERLVLMAEHDTHWFSFGLRAAPSAAWRIDLSLTGGDGIGGAVSYQSMLR